MADKPDNLRVSDELDLIVAVLRGYRDSPAKADAMRAVGVIRAALAEQPPCWCHKCNENKTINGIPFSMTRMIVCPDCGNKRCPKASNHDFACTVSNQPGQIGTLAARPGEKT